MPDDPALLHRIRCTPWSDLLRCELSARNDWKATINQTALSAQSKSMLVELLQKSKLTRSERASVARELVAHFEDGFQSGRDWNDLNNEFGEPSLVAVLIERSKERNRSMLSKIFKSLGLVTGVGVVAFAIWAYFFVNREANPSVDFTKELNVKALASKESDRAWPIYRDAWIKYNFVSLNLDEEARWNDSDLGRSDPNLRFGDIGPSHGVGWGIVVSFLRDHQDLIDSLRAGSRKPALGLELKNFVEDYSAQDQQALFPSWLDNQPEDKASPTRTESERRENSSVTAVMLPHVHALQEASCLMHAHARLEMIRGNINTAIDDIRVIFGLARHTTETSCFVAALVGFTVADSGYKVIHELLNNEQIALTELQLKKIQDLVHSLDVRSMIDTNAERYMVEDILQRTYTDDGDGHGRITKHGLAVMSGLFPEMREQNLGISLTWKFLNSDRKEIKELFDSFYNEFRHDLFKPWHEQPRTVTDLVNSTFEADSPASCFAEAFVSGLDSIRDAYHLNLSKKAAVETAIALHRYKLRHGSFPDELQQLVPEFLAELARDPLSNRPMSMVLDDHDRPKLYFWGHDGMDDRGMQLDGGPNQHQVGRAFGHSAKGYKGDWILWPIE